jgi:histidine ammonia-lyase
MAREPEPVRLDGASLTVGELSRAAAGAPVALTTEAWARVAAASERLRALVASGARVYGLNTGVGSLETDDAAAVTPSARQVALLESHAAGVGAAMADAAVRGMIAARANTLARGVSGVGEATLQALIEMLARGVVPVVPEGGSVGASDLAPLAHVALVLVGRGRARVGGREMAGQEALAAAGSRAIELGGRDALALINGLAASAAQGALAVDAARRLVEAAELAAAMTLAALGAPRDFLDQRLATLKVHPGQKESSARMRELLAGAGSGAGSGLLRAPLSSRYAPQVTGAARSALEFAGAAVEAELNAASDNPILCDDGFVSSNSATTGGQELAQALDLVAIAMTSVAVASERRVASMLDDRSGRLPAFLRHPRARAGVDSGLMIVQYSAASVVAELRARGGPASIQSIPTCAGEDQVSMCSLSARQAAWVVSRAESVVAMEMLCAAQAVDLTGMPLAGRLAEAHGAIRARVPVWVEDRLASDDIAQVIDLLRAGA